MEFDCILSEYELNIKSNEQIIFYLWYSMKKYKNDKVSCISERIVNNKTITSLEKDMNEDNLISIS